jgi:hypothetical protein
MQKDAREENVVEAEEQLSLEVQVEVQQATKVQEMVEAHRRAMEMEKCESEVVVKKKNTILNKATLMEKGIKIPNLKQFMWT